MKGDIILNDPNSLYPASVKMTQIVLEVLCDGKRRTLFSVPCFGGVFFAVRIGVRIGFGVDREMFSGVATLVVDDTEAASAEVASTNPQLSPFTQCAHPDWTPGKPIKVPALSAFWVQFDKDPPKNAVARLQGFFTHQAFEE